MRKLIRTAVIFASSFARTQPVLLGDESDGPRSREAAARIVALVLAASLQFVHPALAQDWPTRPVTMVYPFGAGSAADALGHLLAARLSELLDQSVIFENVGGAGGMTGSSRVAKAAPDGYLFALGGTYMALNQSLYKNPLYNAAADFAPVALIVEQPTILITRRDLPVSNLQEFISYAKANQATMQYGSAGTGSAPHLACALLNAAIGVNVAHVAYRSAAGPMQDLMAGRIDYFCPLAALAIPQIAGNTVKPIALFAKHRLPVLPSLASADEQGLRDFEVLPWYALFLPKGTAAPIVRKLHDATVAAMATPAVQARLVGLGYAPIEADRQSSEYLQTFMKSEIERWAAVIKAAGISPMD
jgi:tripartite-type tricarboxylate transporter receptor subunit TctC